MAASNNSKLNFVGLWVLKAVVALLFVAAGSAKLLGAPMMVQEFGVIGLGQGFRLLTGVIEVIGAILLIVPRTFRFGAPLLLAVSIGACIAQATRLHGDVAHTIIFIAATGFLTWLAWRPATALPAAA